jgi:hypothetical protein
VGPTMASSSVEFSHDEPWASGRVRHCRSGSNAMGAEEAA